MLGTIVAIVGETIALQSGELAKRRRAAPGDRPDVPLRRAGDLGPRARQPHGQADDRVGLTWFIGTATGSSVAVVSELALAFEDTFTVLLVALVLAYPSGRLESRIDRAAVAILAVGATALNILYSTSLPLIADKSSGLYGGPGAGDDDHRRDPPSLGHRARARRGATCCPC